MNTNTDFNQHVIILDTETSAMDGLPIEIAYGACNFSQSGFKFNDKNIFDQYYSIGEEKINFASMAVHNIIEEDITGMPDYKTFKLPEETRFIIGHNIEYDIKMIAKCGLDTSTIYPICTLKIARHVWPDLETHKLTALIYHLTNGSKAMQQKIKNAHNASIDIQLTAILLNYIVEHESIKTIEELILLATEAEIPKKIFFGKHARSYISDLPKSYCTWILSQAEFDQSIIDGIYKYHPDFNGQR